MGYIANCSLAGTRHTDGVSEDLVYVEEDRLLCVADGMSEGRGRMIPAEIRSQIETQLLPELDQTSGMWEWSDHQRMMRTLSDFVGKLNERVLGIGSKACLVLAVRGKPGSPCTYVYSLGDVGCYLASAGLLSWVPVHFPEASREEQRSGTGALQRYLGMKDLPQVESCCSLIASPNYCNAKVIRHFALSQRFYLQDQGGALVAASDGVWGGFGDPGRFREELGRAVSAQSDAAGAVNDLTRRLRDSSASGGDDCSLALWVLGEEGDFRRPLVDEAVHRGVAQFCNLARRVPVVADAFAAYGERLRSASAPGEVDEELAPAWQIYNQTRDEAPAVQNVALLTASVAGGALVREKRLQGVQAQLDSAQAKAAQDTEAAGQLRDKAQDLDLALAVATQREGAAAPHPPRTRAGAQLVDTIQGLKATRARPAPIQPANLYRDDLLLAQDGVDAARAAEVDASVACSEPGRQLLTGIRNVKAKYERASQYVRALIAGLQEAAGQKTRLARINEHTIKYYQDWLRQVAADRGVAMPVTPPPTAEPAPEPARRRWSWAFIATAVGAILFAVSAAFFATQYSAGWVELKDTEQQLSTAQDEAKAARGALTKSEQQLSAAKDEARTARGGHADLRRNIIEKLSETDPAAFLKLGLPETVDADETALAAIPGLINKIKATRDGQRDWLTPYNGLRRKLAKQAGMQLEAKEYEQYEDEDNKLAAKFSASLTSVTELRTQVEGLNKEKKELDKRIAQLVKGVVVPEWEKGAGFFVVWLDKQGERLRYALTQKDPNAKNLDELRNRYAWALGVDGKGTPRGIAKALSKLGKSMAAAAGDVATLEELELNKTLKGEHIDLSAALKHIAAIQVNIDSRLKTVKEELTAQSVAVQHHEAEQKRLPEILRVGNKASLAAVWAKADTVIAKMKDQSKAHDARKVLWYCLADQIFKHCKDTDFESEAKTQAWFTKGIENLAAEVRRNIKKHLSTLDKPRTQGPKTK